MADRATTDRMLAYDNVKYSDMEYAGDHLLIEHDGDRTNITFGEGTGRRCGDCTLCCRLVAVPTIDKAAGTRCHYQGRKGCSVYDRRPHGCRTWACGWIADPECHDMPRPDHAHYVVDITPDYITSTQEDGTQKRVGAIQVWCDPQHPDAWKTPRLRAYMRQMAEVHGCCTVVRFDARRAILVFPPPLAGSSEWIVREDAQVEARSAEEAAFQIVGAG